jgi:hypothetical protein
MSLDVALAIAPPVDEGQTPTMVADRLVQLGGPMVSWTPDMNGSPAKARFKFKNQARRDRFVADALAVRGVALVPLQYESSQGEREDGKPDPRA